MIFEYAVATGRSSFLRQHWIGGLGLPDRELPDEEDFLEWFRGRIDPEDRDRVDEAWQSMLEGRIDRGDIELRIRRGDSEWIWVRLQLRVIETLPGGGPVRILGSILNVEASRMNELNLRMRVRQQRAIAEFGQFALAEVDPESVVRRCAKTVAAQLDCDLATIHRASEPRDEVTLQATVGDIAEDAPDGFRQCIDMLATHTLSVGEPVIVEDLACDDRFCQHDRQAGLGVVSGVSCIVHDRGEPWGVLGACSRRHRRFTLDDIHFLQAMSNVLSSAIQRTRGEQLLREKESRLRLALEAGRMGAWHWDLEADTIGWSPELSPDQSLARDTFHGGPHDFRNGVHPVHEERVSDRIREAIERAEPFGIEYPIIRRDGVERWIELHGAPHAGKDGIVRTVAGICTDITERKSAEFARDLLSQTGRILVSSMDRDTVLRRIALLMIREFCEWCEIELFDDDQRSIFQFGMHRDAEKAERVRRMRERYPRGRDAESGKMRVMRTGRAAFYPQIDDAVLVAAAVDDEHLAFLRSVDFTSVIVVPLKAGDKPIGTLVMVRAENRRRFSPKDLELAEEVAIRIDQSLENFALYARLRGSEERNRLILDSARDVILVFPVLESGCPGPFVQVNPEACRLLGYTHEQFMLMTIADVRVQPEDVIRTRLRLLLETGQAIHEVGYRTSEGGTIPMEENTRMFTLEGRPHLLVVARDMTRRQQAEQALLDLTADLENQVAHRTRELQRQADQLRKFAFQITQAEQSERKRIASIIHDHLQQILVAIRLRLATGLRRSDPAQREESITSSMGLIDDAIKSSRDLTVELRPPVFFEDGLLGAIHWLAGLMHDRHGLSVRVEAEPGADLHSEETGTIVFESIREMLFNIVKHADVDQAEIRLTMLDSWLRIVVHDQGRGFDLDEAEAQQHLSGGVGMFSVWERMAAIGARMRVRSKPGDGTEIELLIPVESGAAEPVGPSPRMLASADKGRDPADTATKEKKRRIRVLLVDDHAIVRQGIAGILGGDDRLRVIAQASNGLEALNIVAARRPQVVVMDVNMPVMNGIEACRQMRQNWPEVAIIGLSVHAESDMAQAMKDAGACDYLFKGGDPDQLIETILRVARGQARETEVSGAAQES